MAVKSLLAGAVACSIVFGGQIARADTATFAAAPITGCPNCVATDTTGLAVSALGHLLPNGWDVRTSVNGLYINNHNGAVFTLPSATFPGKTFDLTGVKLFAMGQTSMTTPVTFTLYAYHFGNPNADVVQVTVNSRGVQTVALSNPRLMGIDTLVVRFDPLQVRYVYILGMTFTPH